jgi:hypothetical protein
MSIAERIDADAKCDAPHLAETRKSALMASRTVEALADTFRVLAIRHGFVFSTRCRSANCAFAISPRSWESVRSAVSHQLRLLRGMRLVRPRRAGRLVYYAVDDQHILELLKQASTHVEESRTAR